MADCRRWPSDEGDSALESPGGTRRSEESMISFRRKDEIYHKEGGWFAANWHFSFDEYHDPENMGWGALRVFNDDRLANDGVRPAGSVQRMTLGSGAYHSEQNGSQTEPIRFIQMWIMPRERGLPPPVGPKVFTPDERTNVLLPGITPDGSS